MEKISPGTMKRLSVGTSGREKAEGGGGDGAFGRVGTDGGMQMHESGCGERRWEEEEEKEEAVKSSKLNK